MKIKLCLLLLFISLKSFAQKEFPLKFGFKLGANISSFTNDELAPSSVNSTNQNSFESSTRGSLMAGITSEYRLNNKISFGAELLYNARGGAYRRKNDDVIHIQDGKASNAYDSYKYKIDYLELPLMVNYQLYKQIIRVYGGVSPGILVKASAGLQHPKNVVGPNMDTQEREKDTEKDLMDITNKFNLSPLLGFQLGNNFFEETLLYIDLRMSYALLPIFKTNAAANTKMFTGTVGVGLKF